MLFDPAQAKIVSAYEMSKYEIPDEDFLLGPRFLPRGGKLLVVGDTEVGKSWICLSIIRALVLGESLFANPEWPTHKSRVLYIESEVGITMPERIKMVFGDQQLEGLDFWNLLRPEGFNLAYSACTEWLKSVIKDRAFDAVVFDPIGDLSTIDESSNSEVGRMLTAIRESQVNAAVVMSHHTGKRPRGPNSDDYDPLELDNLRGASKWKGSIDTALTVARREGQLVSQYESWIVDARWAKTRHARRKPSQGMLFFNELGDGRMLWRDNNPTPRRQQQDVPTTPWDAT